jgi:hypothetical protein
MRTQTPPENWFHNVKKMYVIESVDYYTRKGSTTIIISYKSWWKLSRKLKFLRVRATPDDTEMHQRHPEADVIIKKIKGILDPAFQKTLEERTSPKAEPKSALPSFTETPSFAGWPTAK